MVQQSNANEPRLSTYTDQQTELSFTGVLTTRKIRAKGTSPVSCPCFLALAAFNVFSNIPFVVNRNNLTFLRG